MLSILIFGLAVFSSPVKSEASFWDYLDFYNYNNTNSYNPVIGPGYNNNPSYTYNTTSYNPAMGPGYDSNPLYNYNTTSYNPSPVNYNPYQSYLTY